MTLRRQETSVRRTPQVGDIWKEVDPRNVRYVSIQRVGEGRRSVAIRTVEWRHDGWRDTPRSRLSYADPERFNGRRGGYELHLPAKVAI